MYNMYYIINYKYNSYTHVCTNTYSFNNCNISQYYNNYNIQYILYNYTVCYM